MWKYHHDFNNLVADVKAFKPSNVFQSSWLHSKPVDDPQATLGQWWPGRILGSLSSGHLSRLRRTSLGPCLRAFVVGSAARSYCICRLLVCKPKTYTGTVGNGHLTLKWKLGHVDNGAARDEKKSSTWWPLHLSAVSSHNKLATQSHLLQSGNNSFWTLVFSQANIYIPIPH